MADFFSDFLASAIARHSGQGYCPSKVRVIASHKDCVRKLFASIEVQATVCSKDQFKPVIVTKVTISQNLSKRAATNAIL